MIETRVRDVDLSIAETSVLMYYHTVQHVERRGLVSTRFHQVFFFLFLFANVMPIPILILILILILNLHHSLLLYVVHRFAPTWARQTHAIANTDQPRKKPWQSDDSLGLRHRLDFFPTCSLFIIHCSHPYTTTATHHLF